MSLCKGIAKLKKRTENIQTLLSKRTEATESHDPLGFERTMSLKEKKIEIVKDKSICTQVRCPQFSIYS